MSHELDPRLHRRLNEVRDADPSSTQDPTTRITVYVTFEGELDPLRAGGLQIEMVSGDIAVGNVAVADLERLAESEGVVAIRPETRHQPHLNDSVPATHADHLRTGALGLTGTGVIVGVVDSGIDIFHHCFIKPDGTTRILSLLDMSISHSQTIWIDGAPTGGTFSLRWTPPGSTTGSLSSTIPFNASAADIQAALVALPGGVLNAGDVTVSGGPLPSTPVTVDFGGRYANQTISRMGNGGSVLTGGGSTELVIAPGKVFTAADINAALAHPNQPFASTDPATSGHGTHVTGIAAGNGSAPGHCHGANTYIGVAPNADIVFAKTTFNSTDNVRGAAYVFLLAANQPTPRPAVVNFSFGGQSGAHDGTAEDERMVNALLVDRAGQPLEGRAVVVSSGNDGAITDSSHADQWKLGLHSLKTIPASGSATFTLEIPADDHKADYLELWWEGAGRLTLTVTPPGGSAASAGVPAPTPPTPGGTGSGSSTFPLAGCSVTVDAVVNDPPTTWPGTANPRNKHRFSVTISPPTPPAAPPGGTA
ncbi:MAG: S8 family serine peptidase, partial [Actinomycetota bacterium]|nr:S8 family serine peptidase [Actinomycetota bacterium]